MSSNGYDEFKEALKNEDMRKQLAAFFEEHNPESEADRIQLIVQFAADKGYLISEEELSIEAARLRKVDDEEMENLAGGGFDWCWSSVDCFLAYY